MPSPVALAAEAREAVNLFRTRNLRSAHMNTEPISPRFQRPVTSTTEAKPLSPKIVSFHEDVVISNEVDVSINSSHLVPEQAKL